MTIEQSVLANGLRVVSQTMPGLETAALGLYVDTGSRFEQASENGVAHLFEHMVFKGTARRSAVQIAEEIEAVGGYLNAYTSRDQTAFYARVLGADVALGLDMLADLITSPRFEATDLRKEREVVLQELGQALDTPDDLVFDHLNAVAYPAQPLGRTILGTAASINRLAEADLHDWRARHYIAGSMVLAAAGKVDHDRLVADAARHLGGLPAGSRPAPTPATYHGGEYRDVRELEQVQVALAVPGAAYADADYYAQMLFATALGGGSSSRLFQAVREEHGLVYSIGASLAPYSDSGLFTLALATGAETARAALDLSLDCWQRAVEDLSEAELDRARAQAKAGMFMSLESCAALAESMGRQQLIFNRDIPTQEIVDHIDACTREDVTRCAAQLFSAPLSLAIVGPATDIPEVDRLGERLR